MADPTLTVSILPPKDDPATIDADILAYFIKVTGDSKAADSILADLDSEAKDAIYEKIVRPDLIDENIDKGLVGQKIREWNYNISNNNNFLEGELDNIGGTWTIDAINGGKTFTISKLISIDVPIDQIRGI